MKRVYKVELPNNGKKEVYNVVGTSVDNALSILRWSKELDYDSKEYKEWSEKINEAISVSVVMDNVIA